MENAVRIFMKAVLFAAILAAAAVAESAGIEIESFRDSDKDTAVLHVICPDGKEIEFKYNRKRLNRIKIDDLYKRIYAECRLSE